MQKVIEIIAVFIFAFLVLLIFSWIYIGSFDEIPFMKNASMAAIWSLFETFLLKPMRNKHKVDGKD